VALDVSSIVAAGESHLLRSGLFDAVNRHEPKKAPGHGITAAIWLMEAVPVGARSGLASSTVRVELRVRLYLPMLREPQDDIDPEALRILDALMASYSADFTLDGLVSAVDLLGMSGTPLQARSGYLRQDNVLYRVIDIWLPLLCNDLWEQVP
jgi:hypothetical protein